MKPLILLHGAIGAADQLAPLTASLQTFGYSIHTFSFEGHGKVPFGTAFGIPAFAAQLDAFIRSEGLEQPDVFGYSMGGYVALYLAAQQPGTLGRIATLATKYAWTSEGAQQEVKMLDAATLRQKVPAFASALETRHGADWELLLQRTASMMLELGGAPLLGEELLKKITQQVMVGVGDKDNMVSLEETRELYKALPDARMYMLPGTGHPIEKADPALLAQVLHHFYSR